MKEGILSIVKSSDMQFSCELVWSRQGRIEMTLTYDSNCTQLFTALDYCLC